jgi:hypothetical protein
VVRQHGDTLAKQAALRGAEEKLGGKLGEHKSGFRQD